MNLYSEYQQREFFISQHRKDTLLIPEVPCFSRSVDLVEYDRENQKITAIEFKTTNWKKVIEQVKQVGTCFDYLEICIIRPKTIASETRINSICENEGIGLYLFDPVSLDFYHSVLPELKSFWEIQHKTIVNYLDAILLKESNYAN
jgi:hypothetical protein